MTRVGALWRHPVKSLRGEEVPQLELVEGGVAGDRCWAFEVVATGQLVSGKKFGPVMTCRARPAGDAVAVTFPDGTEVHDPAELARRMSALLGVQVRLVRGAPGTQVDLAPVHLLAAGTLARLRAAHPDGDWDPRRFRPNILLDDGDGGIDGEIDGEDLLLGCDLHIGDEAVLHVVMPTSRCVMTTRAQGDDLPADKRILSVLTEVRRRDVPLFGNRPSAGVYADVVRPGVVRVGDPVRVEPVAPRRGRIAAAIDEIVAARAARRPNSQA